MENTGTDGIVDIKLVWLGIDFSSVIIEREMERVSCWDFQPTLLRKLWSCGWK